MASPRESRGSDNGGLTRARTALFAIPCAAASLNALAHGGGVPAWAGPVLLFILAGFMACVLAPIIRWRQGIGLRIALGLAMAAIAFLAWCAVLWLMGQASTHPGLPESLAWLGFGFLVFWPWIVAIALWIRTGAARKERA